MKQHTIVEISPAALTLNHKLAIGASKSESITHIEHNPRGCKGHVHVNKNKCYDYAGIVEVVAD